MDKNILTQKLQNIGLQKNEARIYLSTLESNTSPVSQIAKCAQMNRVSTHSILLRLLEKGMVIRSERKGISYFTALNPEILIRNTEQKAHSLAESLPFLRSIAGEKIVHPSVRFFEGIEGIKEAYYESLTSQTEILNYANSKNIRDHWSQYDEEYVLGRAERNIFLRGLAPDDKDGKIVQNQDAKYHRETRLIPVEHFQIENEIKIFDENMLITSFEPFPFALIITSKAVADTQRQIFQIAWNSAQRS